MHPGNITGSHKSHMLTFFVPRGTPDEWVGLCNGSLASSLTEPPHLVLAIICAAGGTGLVASAFKKAQLPLTMSSSRAYPAITEQTRPATFTGTLCPTDIPRQAKALPYHSRSARGIGQGFCAAAGQARRLRGGSGAALAPVILHTMVVMPQEQEHQLPD